jgi:hypothetical protein
MKKILLALNPEHIDGQAVDFACYLGKLTSAHITAAFLGTRPSPDATMREGDNLSADEDAINASLLQQATARFTDACICREANHFRCIDRYVTIEELVGESRFSDLLVLPVGLSSNERIKVSATLSWGILSHAHCPAIVAPEFFENIREIVFTYNGSKASVFAIKQFTYLFPQFCDHHILVLAVNMDAEIPGRLKEWMECHYRHIEFFFPEGDPADQLVSFLLPHNDAFVVMGAYSHDTYSRLLKSRTVKPVSGMLFNPMFIAH